MGLANWETMFFSQFFSAGERSHHMFDLALGSCISTPALGSEPMRNSEPHEGLWESCLVPKADLTAKSEKVRKLQREPQVMEICRNTVLNTGDALPIGSMYAIYDNIYHQYTPVMLALIYQHQPVRHGLVPLFSLANPIPSSKRLHSYGKIHHAIHG